MHDLRSLHAMLLRLNLSHICLQLGGQHFCNVTSYILHGCLMHMWVFAAVWWYCAAGPSKVPCGWWPCLVAAQVLLFSQQSPSLHSVWGVACTVCGCVLVRALIMKGKCVVLVFSASSWVGAMMHAVTALY